MAKEWMKQLQTLSKVKAGKPAKAAKAKPGKKISWVFKKPASVREGIEKFTLENGITLITRPSFDTPVVSLRSASLGGSRLETTRNQGATELLSRVWTAGAGTENEMQMNLRMDEMAGEPFGFWRTQFRRPVDELLKAV